METWEEKLLASLNEAVDSLGDIPADRFTEEEKRAYRCCLEVVKILNSPH